MMMMTTGCPPVGCQARALSACPAVRQSLQPCTTLFIDWIFHNESRINLLCWCTSVYMVWHQNIWRERVFSCPLYLADHTSVPLRTTNFLYRDRSLLPWALWRSVHPTLPRGTLFQLGYGTHTDTRTVQVFAQDVIVCVTVTARALVTVLCYFCVLKCLFIIITILLYYVFMIIARQSSQIWKIGQFSDRHTQLETVLPRSYRR